MSPRTVERVDGWETVPFGGGYGGLRDLASQEFSGVVTAGPTRLFMIRGTVVGVLDGSIDDFEDSGGNAHEAPHPTLPLLAVMQERSDEVRAKYYTEETPISDVDRTLADGSFTGYVELSENVLSGDYYQVYHQGRSMSVAYVGSSERLITDDEAFDQADDEVGIYEVRPVDIEAIDIPEPTDDAGDATGTAATDTDESPAESTTDEGARDSAGDEAPASEPDTVEIPSATNDADAGETETSGRGTDEPETGRSPSQESTAAVEPDEPTDESGSVPEDTSSTPADDPQSTPSTSDPADSDPATDQSTDSGPDDAHPGARSSSSSPSSPPSTEQSSEQETATDQPSQSRDPAGGNRGQRNTAEPEASRRSPGADQPRTDRSSTDTRPADAGPGSQGNGERTSGSSPGSATDLEVRSIPSLDPTRTEAASKTKAKRKSGGRSAKTAQQSQSERSQQSQQRSDQSQEQQSTQQTSDRSTRESGQQPSERSAQQRPGQSDQTQGGQQAGGQDTTRQSSPAGAEASELESELESHKQEIEDLRTDLERVEAERDELETERADLEAERDRLQTELEESRAEIERLSERLEDFAEDGASAAETQLSANEAIDDTNLFVRYNSKGDATLETAHSGNADRSSVAENMRLEYHTQFDADTAAVGNESFDDFLTGTIQYRFVDWIISSLLYEVRDTGHADGMADLYNALPKIDRAELNGQVSVNYTEDGEEHRSQERFDVVVRDRMGNPLVVANINNSRDPATDAMMTDLVKRAERVGESGDTLAGAFLVTESFFEPEALETAEGATSSGLFSRDRRKSFVNLSRKGGYHLCLVEARNNEFHLAVPEL